MTSVSDDTDRCLCDTIKTFMVKFLDDPTDTANIVMLDVVRSSPPKMLCSTVHTVRTPSQSLRHSPKR